jgi:ABC-type transport system involved in multi-copper enzyme maturation permease subunit
VKTSLHAELRKLRYQRSTYGILASAAALAAISSISLIATSQLPRRAGMFLRLTDEATMHLVMSAATGGYIFALVLGIVMSTTEFRHSTAVATYLAQPHRRTVMIAKMIIAAMMGVIVQFVSTGVGMLAGYVYVQRYEHFDLTSDAYIRIMAGSVLVGAVLAVVGVAIGSLIRSQMVAVVVSLLWLQLIEGLIIVFADWLGKWSMRSAISSVLDVAVRVHGPQGTLDTTQGMGPWQSVALLLAYGAVFAVVATVTSMRRDVD